MITAHATYLVSVVIGLSLYGGFIAVRLVRIYIQRLNYLSRLAAKLHLERDEARAVLTTAGMASQLPRLYSQDDPPPADASGEDLLHWGRPDLINESWSRSLRKPRKRMLDSDGSKHLLN